MNMPLSIEALEDAAAMANILIPMRDIIAMREGKLKPTKPVLDLLIRLSNGEYIAPNKDAAREARKPRATEKTKRNSPVPINDRFELIKAALKGHHRNVTELAEALGMREAALRSVLIRMVTKGLVMKQHICGNKNIWYLPDYTNEYIESVKKMRDDHRKAVEIGQVYYEGLPCDRCGTTKRHAVSNRCLHCSQTKSREHYHKMRNQELQQSNYAYLADCTAISAHATAEFST